MKKSLLPFIFSLFIFHFCQAQPGALDMSFNPGIGPNDAVYALVVQPDNKVLIGGAFGLYGGTNYRGFVVIRLNPNGTQDTTFHSGSGGNGEIYALATQTDGKILVGGQFGEYDGDSTIFLTRLNSDGHIDTSFHVASGFSGPTLSSVRTITLQPDGKILIGGGFTSYNGISCSNIIRLNTDGTADTSFHPISGADATVEAIALQSDGRIVIGGDFDYYDGDLVIRTTRLNADGLRDTSFHATGTSTIVGVDAVVHDIAIEPLGKIILGGNFNNIALQSRRKVARLLPNGDLDGYFNLNGTGGNSEVFAMKLLNDGKILAGGNFTIYNDSTSNRIMRLDSSGRLDTVFNAGAGPLGSVYAIKLQADGRIIIAGSFSNYNGITRNQIARLYNCLTPQPDSISGLGFSLCAGTQQTYSVNPVSGATKYEWTLPTGWTGSSDSASITATSNGSGGVISVRAFSDSCGYSYTTTKTISTIQPPGVDICSVTVDSQSTHNIIYWDKPITHLIDSFFIYRETSTNVYTKIGAVPYDSLSEYNDLDTNANPNSTSHRYKLSVLDTCGAESALSPYHNTIHLQNLGGGNFQWTFYQIENALNPVLSFNIYRDNLGNGNFFPIGNVPGTNATFTDVTFNSFPNSIYVVDVNWSISCNPGRMVSTSRSNIRHKNEIEFVDTTTTGFINRNDNEQVQVYPNPVKETIRIIVPETVNITRLQLSNAVGQLVLSATDKTKVLNVADLPKGFYTLSIETNKGRVNKKVIIE